MDMHTLAAPEFDLRADKFLNPLEAVEATSRLYGPQQAEILKRHLPIKRTIQMNDSADF